MKTRKLLASVLLCSALASCWAGTCLAEQTLTITEKQLVQLENNNGKLMSYNKMQLKELSELKVQVKILQQELSASEAALLTAQQSLNKMSESTKRLERKIKVNKIGVGVIATNYGAAPVVAFRQNNFEVIGFYSDNIKGTGAVLWF